MSKFEQIIQCFFFLCVQKLILSQQFDENIEKNTQHKCQEIIWLREGEKYSNFKHSYNFVLENIEQSLLSLKSNITYSHNTTIVDIIFIENSNYSEICSLEMKITPSNYLINCNYRLANEIIDNKLVFTETGKLFDIIFTNGEQCIKIIKLLEELFILCSKNNRIELFYVAYQNITLKYSFSINEDQKECEPELLLIQQLDGILILSKCQNWRIVFLRNLQDEFLIDQQFILQQLGSQYKNETLTLLTYQLCYFKLYVTFNDINIMIDFQNLIPVIQVSNVKSYSQVKHQFNNQNCYYWINQQQIMTSQQFTLQQLLLQCLNSKNLETDSEIMLLDNTYIIIYNRNSIIVARPKSAFQTFNYTLSFLFYSNRFRYLFGIDANLNLLFFKIYQYINYFEMKKNESSLIVSPIYEKFGSSVFYKNLCVHKYMNNMETNQQIQKDIEQFQSYRFEVHNDDEAPYQFGYFNSIIHSNKLLKNCMFQPIGNNNFFQIIQSFSLVDICKIDDYKYLRNITYFLITENYLILQGKNDSIIFYHCKKQLTQIYQIKAKLSQKTVQINFKGVMIISGEFFYQFCLDDFQITMCYSYQFSSNIKSFSQFNEFIIFLLQNSIIKLSIMSSSKSYLEQIFSEITNVTTIEQVLINFYTCIQYQDYIEFKDSQNELIQKFTIEAEIIRFLVIESRQLYSTAQIILIPKKQNAIHNYLIDQNELIFLNEFPLLHFALMRPLVYCSFKQYFAVSVYDIFNQSLAVIIYDTTQSSMASIIAVIYVQEQFFGFRDNHYNSQFFYYSQGIQILLLNSLYLKANTILFRSIVEKYYLMMNCSSFINNQFFKSGVVEFKIHNYIYQLQLINNEKAYYLVPENNFCVDLQRHLKQKIIIYGPIDNLKLQNYQTIFQLQNPILQTHVPFSFACEQTSDGLCLTSSNQLFFSELNSSCQLPINLLQHQIQNIFQINKTSKVVIVQEAQFQLLIYLLDCSQSIAVKISDIFLNITSDDRSFDCKLENNLLVIKLKKKCCKDSSQGIIYLLNIFEDKLLQIELPFEFYELYQIKQYPKENHYLFFQQIKTLKEIPDSVEFSIFLVQEERLIKVEDYKVTMDQLELLMEAHALEPNFSKFNMLMVDYTLETRSVAILLSYLAKEFYICLFHLNLNLNKQIKIELIKILRSPILLNKEQNDLCLRRFNHEFLLLDVKQWSFSDETEQYLYSIQNSQLFYDYIYKLEEQINQFYQFNSTHFICSQKQFKSLLYFLEVGSYSILFDKKKLDLGQQYQLTLHAINQVSKLEFQLILDFQNETGETKNTVFNFLGIVLLMLLILILYYCYRRTRLLQTVN